MGREKRDRHERFEKHTPVLWPPYVFKNRVGSMSYHDTGTYPVPERRKRGRPRKDSHGIGSGAEADEVRERAKRPDLRPQPPNRAEVQELARQMDATLSGSDEEAVAAALRKCRLLAPRAVDRLGIYICGLSPASSAQVMSSSIAILERIQASDGAKKVPDDEG